MQLDHWNGDESVLKTNQHSINEKGDIYRFAI